MEELKAQDNEIEAKNFLEEIKKHLQVIFDSIGDGIQIINRGYEILRANKGILTIFGKSDFPEIIGKKCFNEYYHREAICDHCPAKKTFEEGKPSQLTKISRDTGKRMVLLSKYTFPIKAESGNVIQVIECIKDITPLMKLEDQLFYSERLAGIEKLAAGVAHEIRNPLSNIKAAAQFCLNKYDLDKQIIKHFKIILKNSEKVNKVTKDLLNLAKPSDVPFKIGSINKVINSLCSLINARCLKQRIRLTKRFPRGLPQIFLNKKLLEEAFLNFALNGLDAMPRGGRLVITAYYDHKAEEIIVSFADSGCGISEYNLSRIFDPFFTTKKNGTGLGLSLALQTIELHKGKIHIESKLDYGTEVTVRLPAYSVRIAYKG